MAIRLTKAKYRAKSGDPITTIVDALRITSAITLTRGEFALYRGQSGSNHILRPSVFRKSRWFRHERDMVRELISTHPQEFLNDGLMLDKLVRMQHYGLPTRLLDVTQNFLAALFFASGASREIPDEDGAVYIIKGSNHYKKYYDSDAVSLVTNMSNLSEAEKKDLFSSSPDNDPRNPEDDNFNRYPSVQRLLQFVRDEKPYFRPRALKSDLFRTFFVIPKKNNRRIVAQSGAFLVFGVVDTDRSPDLSMFEITKHRVPAGSKGHVRAELVSLGITEGSLFPEIDHAAAYIAAQYAV